MGAPTLTETTIRYLFATEWLPPPGGEHAVRVPGGKTKGIDTGGNLLHIAMWNLRRRKLMEFEQIRPVEKEPMRVLGGRSFSRYRLLTPTARMPGLEGALLNCARAVEADEEGAIDRLVKRASGEDPRGVRRLIRRLDLDNRSPWGTVCSYCLGEARAAGLLDIKGRFFKKVVIADPAGMESLREQHDELRAARGAYLKAEPDLIEAVTSDCLRTVIDAYSSDSTPGG